MTGCGLTFDGAGQIDGSAVEKEFFRQSGFSGINVRRDANDSLKKLEKISTSLKAEDITLEDAIKQYEEGIRYYKECSEILQDAQQRIETLTKQE